MKLLFENKRDILSIFLTILMVLGTHIAGYADENSAPVFIDGNRAIRAIAENTPPGVNIGVPVAATDADNDTLTYTKGWIDGMAFSLDSNTGQIRTKAPLDYETKSLYSFAVFADDGNGGRRVISVTINVTDVDETAGNNAPIFKDGDSATRSVAENTASGRNIGSAIAATDADDDTLTYTLAGTDATAFSIVSTSGQLQTNAALNYESKSSYSVSVSVSDGNGGSDSIPVTINVTNVNEAPSFATNTATRSIAENTAANTNIGSPVTATDVDANTTFSYTLGGTDAASFGIVGTTGQLRTSAALNYETKTSYSVTVTASDGSLSDTINVTISVTDVNEAPSFASSTATRSVAENTASGQNIGTAVSATDPDSDTLTYTLGGDDTASFSIVSTTGQLQTSAALDRETKSSYSVTITADDGNTTNNTDSIDVTISVTNVNEKPTFSTSGRVTLSVAENTVANTNIGDPFQATDPDSGDTMTYSLQRGDKDAFSINANTGQLQTRAALDYETKNSYSNLAVRATDSEGLVSSVLVTINVTNVNEAPSFTEGSTATRSVAENTASGTNIGTAVAATDVDANTTLAYTLGGTDAASFSIISTSGQLQTNAALDYETKSSYSVTVEVSDNNGGSDSITVSINVTDVDENRAPAFTDGTSTTRSIAENTASGENIGSVVAATDADTGDTLTYTLGGTDASSFSIVGTSGQLQTNAALNYESKSSYSVTVSVSDGNGGTDSIAVTINVTDVNEKPSFNISGRVTLSVAENTAAGTNIGDPFQATDPDSGDTMTYSLQRDDKDAFRIDANTGQLQTRAALDYETKRSYSQLAVRATDSQGLINSVLVTINVTDVSEITPPLSERTPQVRDGIVAAAGVNSVGDVTEAHLAAITSLDLSNELIRSLKTGDFNGLTALTSLTLAYNSISNISALENLTTLTSLLLGSNSISDISALEDLTSLSRLALSDNSISDISALEDLTTLTSLNLMNNSISDISALEDLTALTHLYLGSNSITDVSALENLTALTSLYLSGNSISDYGPLHRLKAAIEVIEGHLPMGPAPPDP